MLAENLREWKKEWVKQGKTEGRIEGKAEGLAAGRIEGLAAGRIEGREEVISAQKTTLLEILSQRFGEISPLWKERIGTLSNPSVLIAFLD